MALPPPTRISAIRRTLTGETLTCPRCQSRLVPKLQQEIEVDVCPLCQGIWLDRNELDQLLAAALWEVERYAARMAELPNVAAATKTEVSVSRSELDRRVGLQREGQTGAPEPGRVAPQPSLGEVLSRFKNNFGRFFRRLKQTG